MSQHEIDHLDLSFLAPAEREGEIGRLDGYRLLRVIAGGGMGIVFAGVDEKLDRRVAVKVMKPAIAADEVTRQRFLREARAMAAVQHEHVATIHAVAEERGSPFIVMELLQGEALETRLQRLGKIAASDAAAIGRQVALGLEAIHARGLIHRDVKPGNILIVTRGAHAGEQTAAGIVPDGEIVKIVDFGLARSIDDLSVTQSGVVLGTPLYMAPEQASADAVDERADLYSLGAVLYRMTTGRPPLTAKDFSTLLLALATEDPMPPDQVATNLPADFSNFIRQLLAKKAADRPASAAEAARTLAKFASRDNIKHGQSHVKATVAWIESSKPNKPEYVVAATRALHDEHETATRKRPKRRGSWLARIFFAMLILALLALPFIGIVALIDSRAQPAAKAFVTINGIPLGRAVDIRLTDHGGRIRERKKTMSFHTRTGEFKTDVLFHDENGEWRILRFPPYFFKKDESKTFDISKNMLLQAEYYADQRARRRLTMRQMEGVKLAGRPARVYSIRSPWFSGDELADFQNLHGLRELKLSSSWLQDEDLAHLHGLKILKTLDLSGTLITDNSLKTIATMPALESVVLRDDCITDAGLPQLAAMKNLSKLDVRGTEVTAAGVKKLQEALPQLQIEYDINPNWITLLNGKDLAEWRAFPEIDKEKYFRVKENALRATGVSSAAILATAREFRHFILDCEWRVVQPGNHASIHFDYVGKDQTRPRGYNRVACDDRDSGFLFTSKRGSPGTFKNDPAARIRAFKGIGEWNSMQLIRRYHIVVRLNGEIVSRAIQTAGHGPISISARGTIVELKNLRIRPLVNEKAKKGKN